LNNLCKYVCCARTKQHCKSKPSVLNYATQGDDKTLIIGLMLSRGVIENYHQLESILPEIDEHEAQASNAKVIENQWKLSLKLDFYLTLNHFSAFK
jgi:formate dehydrogenase assembly factor FdhD